jgi:hypothetical protein
MRIGCVSKQIEYLAASAILVFSLTDVRAQAPEPAKTDTYCPHMFGRRRVKLQP